MKKRNEKGITVPELLLYLMGGVAAMMAYIHSTFTTYREFGELKEQNVRIEKKVNRLLGLPDEAE